MADRGDQEDLLSGVSDLDLMRSLLADLHDDLPQRLQRLRYITDIQSVLGAGGTMVFGGFPAYSALAEARSSFVNGNFVATVLLCQSLIENLLAAYLHAALVEDIPAKVRFDQTLKRCKQRGLLSEEDMTDLTRLRDLRNPLSHFRHVGDDSSVHRRSMASDQAVDELLRKDAHFAIGVAVRILAKPPFRVG